jgi:hypothetical protein
VGSGPSAPDSLKSHASPSLRTRVRPEYLPGDVRQWLPRGGDSGGVLAPGTVAGAGRPWATVSRIAARVHSGHPARPAVRRLVSAPSSRSPSGPRSVPNTRSVSPVIASASRDRLRLPHASLQKS